MSSQTDRRAPDATRIPFDVMVEVGGAQGPSFEAQAINVSTTGIALRAGYLPAVGQPLTCQFETEGGEAVLAAGEVTWCHDGPDGGEFGLSFGQLDQQSLASLATLLRVEDPTEPEEASGAPAPRLPLGRVRLHIDGLGAPMRARVRDASAAKVTTTSELGYLTAGKLLELEDAETGDKRPARIHRVQVETNAANVPQLVVTMKYQDTAAATDAEASEPVVAPRGRAQADEDDEHDGMKHDFGDRAKGVASSVGAGLKKLGPALGAVLFRAKTAAGMLAQKRKAASEDAPVRRKTAPAPAGALHSAGRKVVRAELEDEPEAAPPPKVDKRKLGIAGAVGVALILGLVAMRKPAEPAPLASPPPEPVAAVVAAPLAAPLAAIAPAASAATVPVVSALPPQSPETNAAFGGDSDEETTAAPSGKKGKAKPFSNGPVAHGNVLRLKMDGPIERLQGASQPTGFTVVLPNRRSLEAASPLASKDPRIAGIRVANDSGGAELTVTFKDGVPNYLVRAKGDTLEMVLAKEKVATADAKPAKKGHKAAGRGKGRKGHGKH